MLFLLLAATVGVLLAPAPGVAQTSSPEESSAVLRPGDAVRITVWRNEELSGEFAVAEDGSIMHPLYRQIRISNLTLPAAEERIRAFLTTLESAPQFVVEPLLRVSVGGEVRQPSLYQLPPETSIAQAVALAGGATERGRLDRVRLFRGGEEIHVDLTRPEAGMAQEPIRSGDQIFVSRRISLFRDYIAPAGSLAAALVSFIGIITR
jgi:protein involved in polysaccharide export with SLBB domain